MHDAAELFLVLVAQASDADVKSSMEFLAYWDVIDTKLAPDQLGHKAEMAAINKARVGFKHSGVIPSRAEIRRFVAMTRSFLEDATPTVFGVALDQATLVDLVPSAAVRTALQEAEAAIAAGDVATAMGRARVGFELSLREDDERVRQATGSHPLRITAAHLPSAFSLSLQKLHGQFGLAWDDLIAVVKRTDDAVRLMAKGIDYADYMRFAALTPHPFWSYGRDEPTLISGASQAAATIDDARWAVDFAIRSVLIVLG